MIFDICGCGPEKLKFRAKLMISMAISIGKMINSLIWNVSDTPMSGIMRTDDESEGYVEIAFGRCGRGC
jgi:hypothetical protein